jgi:antibiotic biosynthesis monooxygenase
MYASVRRYRVDPDSVDELTHRVDEGFAELVSREPGFCSYQTVDAGDGTLMTITCFHDEADASRSADMAADWVKENLSDMDIERTDALTGEVTVNRAMSEVLEPVHH